MLTVTGLVCHILQAAVFMKLPTLVNNHVAYRSSDGSTYLYNSEDERDKWLFDDDMEEASTGFAAYIRGEENLMPPAGPAVSVREQPTSRCDAPAGGSGWFTSVISIQEHFTAGNCAALARALLHSPACVDSTADNKAAGAQPICSVACAEIWLPAIQRCADSRQQGVFEATGGGAALTEACQASAAAVLATAPSSVAIAGLQEHPRANTAYFLGTIPRHGRPQYISEDGAHTLRWWVACLLQ